MEKNSSFTTNFVLLFWSRNMIGQFIKTSLHRPIKIAQFLTCGRIKKCLAQLQKILVCITILLGA